MTNRWSQEAKATVAKMLVQGKTAAQIGKVVDKSRNAVVGVVHRDPELAKIGFSGRNWRTKEERLAQRKKYDAAYRAKQRGETNVIRIKFGRQPKEIGHTSAPPKLRVVSNNVPMMISDWLAQHGGARRFEHAATSDTMAIRLYLEERGIKLNGHRGKWAISRGPGRPKTGTWADVMRIADDFRVAEGLQPFAARNMPMPTTRASNGRRA